MAQRIRQIGWMLLCLAEIRSDMSVFHRVRDFTKLPSDTAISLAELLPSYHGAVRAKLSKVWAEHQRAEQQRLNDAVHHPAASDLFEVARG